MAVSSLNTNLYLKALYTSSLINNVNSKDSQTNELDSVYQAMQTLPTFSWQAYQKQQDQYRNSVSNFSEGVRDLVGSVKSFMANATSDQRSVSSSGNVVTGEAKAGAKIAQYSVNVKQVATAQSNEGKTLNASAYGGVTAGISTFGIKVGNGLERQVSVKTLTTDTNSQALKKFASAINNSGAGVTAEVKTKNSGQYLSITSKDTGAANNFTIRDITGSGVGNLQLTNKVVSAADAKYSVDGTDYQTSTNKVSLDNGKVSLNINATTTGTVKVDVGKDNNKLLTATKKLVNSYNNFRDVLSNSANNITKFGATALSGVEYLVGTTGATAFSSIGISLDQSTGYLQVDEKALSAALASDPSKVNNLLTGYTNSLGKSIERAAKAIGNAPVSSYVKPPNPLDSFTYGSSYGSTYNANYNSKYNTSGWMFAQNNLSQGLFLNMMV